MFVIFKKNHECFLCLLRSAPDANFLCWVFTRHRHKHRNTKIRLLFQFTNSVQVQPLNRCCIWTHASPSCGWLRCEVCGALSCRYKSFNGTLMAPFRWLIRGILSSSVCIRDELQDDLMFSCGGTWQSATSVNKTIPVFQWFLPSRRGNHHSESTLILNYNIVFVTLCSSH